MLLSGPAPDKHDLTRLVSRK